MKKALLSLTLIVLFIGGWGVFSLIQVWIPAGNFGVLTTKTGSVHSQVLEPGKFFWTPELLLPTNAQVMLFPSKERTQEFSLEGELPSGTTYGTFLGDPQAFQFQLKGRWQGKTQPTRLTQLVAEGLITPESWDIFLESEAAEVLHIIQQWAAGYDNANQGYPTVPPEIFKNLKVWQNLTVVLTSVALPDRRLYDLTSSQYLDTQKILQGERVSRTVRSRLFEQGEKEKLQWLEKYGQLLKEHPLVLELWRLSKDIPELKPLLPGVQ